MKKMTVVVLGLVLAAGLVMAGCKTTDQKTSGKCPMGKASASCDKASKGCCKMQKGQAEMICPKCGEVCGSAKCCKDGAVKCSKCGLDAGSPGCKAACGKS
ncbi:MAG TPA: hypothetical protein PLE77_15210 [Kiritimatiellia bacterium]|nr:hypothetical protein [Kiritimatiellia bacterium]